MSFAPISIDTAQNMLSYIDCDDRDQWVKMAYIFQDEFGEVGFDAWNSWSADGADYNVKAAEAVWKSAKSKKSSGGARIGTLVKLAKEGGFKFNKADRKPIDPAETARRLAEREARIEAAEAQDAIDRENCRVTSIAMWDAANPAEFHPYLQKKRIPGTGARVLKGELLIPVRLDKTGIVGLQRITGDGSKYFVEGIPMELGGYTVLGKPDASGWVVIVEGYATGVSVHLATGWCVIVAFNAGNLVKVARKIRAAMPGAKIVMGADDDIFTKRKDGTLVNPGLEAASASAVAIGGYVAAPEWYNARPNDHTDFNDLACDEGLDAVRACFAPEKLGSLAQAQEPGSAAPFKQPEAVMAPDTIKPASDGPAPSAANNPGNSGVVPTFSLPDAVVTQAPGQPQTCLGADVTLPAGTQMGTFGIEASVSRHNAAIAYGLDANENGQPFGSTANMTRVIMQDASLARTIWYDEFLDRVRTVWRGPASTPREWADIDDINLHIYLQESLGLPRLSKNNVIDAVRAAAAADTRNEAQAYINGVTWDGVERLPTFMIDIFGADDSEYTRGAGSNFWISMVARVMQPGCKVDTMIVLEGLQGAGKSKALNIIGGQWFAEASDSPGHKDFLQNLKGKMLIEIGEMDAFSRAEVTKVKQVITCQTDRYRSSYGRHSADHARKCVFAGTTNRDDWNKDETGARRFWPITCTTVDHAALVANRDQYFAEAAHKLAAGAAWWDMPEAETKAQQEGRRDADELETMLINWLARMHEVTVQSVMSELMMVPLERQDRALQMRIGKALRAIGWKRPEHPVWRDGKTLRVWTRRTPLSAEEPR